MNSVVDVLVGLLLNSLDMLLHVKMYNFNCSNLKISICLPFFTVLIFGCICITCTLIFNYNFIKIKFLFYKMILFSVFFIKLCHYILRSTYYYIPIIFLILSFTAFYYFSIHIDLYYYLIDLMITFLF